MVKFCISEHFHIRPKDPNKKHRYVPVSEDQRDLYIMKSRESSNSIIIWYRLRKQGHRFLLVT